jgi:hypothetical protein
MKAVYCYAMNAFFKVVECDHCFTDRELEHLAKGEWLQVDLAEGFDGNLSHYTLIDGVMSVIPESEWPENQEEPV